MGLSRQEYWSGLPFPSAGDLPNPGIEPVSPVLAGGFFTTEPQGSPRLNEAAQSHKAGRAGAKLYTQELWISASFLEVARRLEKVFQVCRPRGHISYILSLYILQICLLTRSPILVLIFFSF